MNSNEVIETFKRTGALLEGHFILSSGLHSSIYLQCAIALESTTVAMDFGAAIAERLKDQQIETVASPAIGGIVIGYEVARQLRARFLWTEREEGRMTLRSGFAVHQGQPMLVAQDVDTNRCSTRETIRTLPPAAAEGVAAA